MTKSPLKKPLVSTSTISHLRILIITSCTGKKLHKPTNQLTMDWVGQQLATTRGSVWRDFTTSDLYLINRQRLEIKLIKNILETEAGQRNLEIYLQSALHLTKDEVEAILWEPPRSLLGENMGQEMARVRRKSPDIDDSPESTYFW